MVHVYMYTAGVHTPMRYWRPSGQVRHNCNHIAEQCTLFDEQIKTDAQKQTYQFYVLRSPVSKKYC